MACWRSKEHVDESSEIARYKLRWLAAVEEAQRERWLRAEKSLLDVA
jgi:hypothetical protein